MDSFLQGIYSKLKHFCLLDEFTFFKGSELHLEGLSFLSAMEKDSKFPLVVRRSVYLHLALASAIQCHLYRKFPSHPFKHVNPIVIDVASAGDVVVECLL